MDYKSGNTIIINVKVSECVNYTVIMYALLRRIQESIIIIHTTYSQSIPSVHMGWRDIQTKRDREKDAETECTQTCNLMLITDKSR